MTGHARYGELFITARCGLSEPRNFIFRKAAVRQIADNCRRHIHEFRVSPHLKTRSIYCDDNSCATHKAGMYMLISTISWRAMYRL